MSDLPLWFTQLYWSSPVKISQIHTGNIPPQPGCYVFTEDDGPLVPGNVLYVGKAIRLRTRIPGYLADYRNIKATDHKGKAFIFEARHKGKQLYLRWTLYGDTIGLEGDLIGHLEPQVNSRWEEEFLADDEGLDPQFVF